MLLVLSNGRFPLYHLHFHSSRHEKLGAILAVSTFLLLLLEDGIVLCSIVAMALVVVLLVVSYTLGGGRYVTTSRLVAASASTSSSDLCRVLVVSIELMDVQGVATLVHVSLVLSSLSVAINLNSLGAVALLSVKLASLLMTNVDRLDKEGLVVASSSVRRMSRHASSLLANHRLTGWVEAEVGLSHQLLVEGCVDTSISVEVASLMHLLLLSRTSISSLTARASSFE